MPAPPACCSSGASAATASCRWTRSRPRRSGCARTADGCRSGQRRAAHTTGAAHRCAAPRSHYPDGTVRSCLADVAGLQALRPLHDLELDPLSLGERLEALTTDCGEVHEHVLATLLRDETETLRVVEPLHSTRRHC